MDFSSIEWDDFSPALFFSAAFLWKALSFLQLAGAILILGGTAFGESFRQKQLLSLSAEVEQIEPAGKHAVVADRSFALCYVASSTQRLNRHFVPLNFSLDILRKS